MCTHRNVSPKTHPAPGRSHLFFSSQRNGATSRSVDVFCREVVVGSPTRAFGTPNAHQRWLDEKSHQGV